MTAVSALVGGEGVEPSVQIIAALAAYPPVVVRKGNSPFKASYEVPERSRHCETYIFPRPILSRISDRGGAEACPGQTNTITIENSREVASDLVVLRVEFAGASAGAAGLIEPGVHPCAATVGADDRLGLVQDVVEVVHIRRVLLRRKT